MLLRFFAKFCNYTNSRVLISSMTIVFSNSSPKVTQVRHFWSQTQKFLFFCKILQLGKIEGADFKYGNSFFKFQPKSTQLRHFWSQIQTFLFFCKILQLEKLQGADFKYDNSFSTSRTKVTQIRYVWSEIQTFLFLF